MKKLVCIALLLLLILTFGGCGDVSTGSGKGFTHHITEEVTSLDPQTSDNDSENVVITALFEGLCRLDPDGEAIPGVASEWEFNADHTHYTFHLREDAVWSNGTPVTAEDFVFAIRRVLSPETEIPDIDDLFCISNARSVHEGAADPSALGVTAADSHTLVFDLEYSVSDFPKLTASARFMPCNEEFFTSSAGRYGLGPEYLLTNGPFKFSRYSSWPDSTDIELVYSDTYCGENNVIPESLNFIGSAADGEPIEKLVSGMDDIRTVDESHMLDAEAAGCTVYPYSNEVTGLTFNLKDPVIKNKELRELFVKTIDRDALIADVTERGCVLSDLIPFGFELDGREYRESVGSSLYVQEDTEITNNISDILDSLGLEAIPSVTILCDEDAVSIASTIISGWNETIGSYFNILPLPHDELISRIADGDYQIALYSISAHSDNIRSFLSPFESSSYPCLLSSEQFDSMLSESGESSSDYAVMEKFLNDNYIFYPICSRKSYYASAPDIEGLSIGFGYMDFKRGEKN